MVEGFGSYRTGSEILKHKRHGFLGLGGQTGLHGHWLYNLVIVLFHPPPSSCLTLCSPSHFIHPSTTRTIYLHVPLSIFLPICLLIIPFSLFHPFYLIFTFILLSFITSGYPSFYFPLLPFHLFTLLPTIPLSLSIHLSPYIFLFIHQHLHPLTHLLFFSCLFLFFLHLLTCSAINCVLVIYMWDAELERSVFSLKEFTLGRDLHTLAYYRSNCTYLNMVQGGHKK